MHARNAITKNKFTFVTAETVVLTPFCEGLPPFAPTTRRNEPDAGFFWRALLFGGS